MEANCSPLLAENSISIDLAPNEESSSLLQYGIEISPLGIS